MVLEEISYIAEIRVINIAVDKRKKLVAVVAHCLLNQNTVVKPLASHRGTVESLIELLVRLGYGIVQLPCPEAVYAGMRRWWMSREQYDNPGYRAYAERVLEYYVDLIEELTRDGCRYILIGVEGSPSCALELTTSNKEWEGEPRIDQCANSIKINMPGVFMDLLLKKIRERGLPEPLLTLDINHREAAESGLPGVIYEKLALLATTINNRS